MKLFLHIAVLIVCTAGLIGTGRTSAEDVAEVSVNPGEAVALRILVVLYPNTFTHEMTADEIANFHHEMAEWVAWYDETAGDRLKLELDFMQIETRLSPRASGPQGNDVYWMSGSDMENDLLIRGVPKNHYDSVVCFWGWDRSSGTARQAYGGGALGPAPDYTFFGDAGRTSYFGSAVLTDHPDRTSKNATHEFLHNIDAMFDTVGYEPFWHADRMAAMIDELLSDLPGAFLDLGMTDDAMRELAASEKEGKAGFSWPMQLVYYAQMFRRTPRDEFARLLERYGHEVKAVPRTRLYENFLLPAGIEPYQVYFFEKPGLESVTLDDYDFTDTSKLVWSGTVWTGEPEDGEGVTRCREALIKVPDTLDVVIGQTEPELNLELVDFATGEGIEEAKVVAVLGDEKIILSAGGCGKYSAPLPERLTGSIPVVYRAESEGYILSEVPADISVKAAWTLSTEWTAGTGSSDNLCVTIEGPPGEYAVDVRIEPEPNTIERMLERDGLLKFGTLHKNVVLESGDTVPIPVSWDVVSACKYSPVLAEVKWTREDGREFGFIHRIPAEGRSGKTLRRVSPTELPDYVVRAKRVARGADGGFPLLDAEPPFILSPATCNVFGGTIDGDADASAEIRLGYDDDNLYVAAKVRDDRLPGSDFWDTDRLNLVFDAKLDGTVDAYPDGTTGHTGWAVDDYWIFLAPNLPTGPVNERLGGVNQNNGRTGYYGAIEGACATVSREEYGYSLEWTVPLASLPFLKPSAGDLVGFTVFYTDADEANVELMYLLDWWGDGGVEWRFWDCGLLYFE